DRDRLGARMELVEELDRPYDRLACGLAAEELEVEVVPVDVRHPALEEVAEPGVGVLADRDQEVRLQVAAVDAGGELLGERALALVRRVVEEVLLELVEDQEQGRLAGRGRRLDRAHQ